MKPLILSWEYPPRIVGGLGTHVHMLTQNLNEAGIKVTVLTRGYKDLPDYENINGIEVYRVPVYPPIVPQEDWVTWSLQFNVAIIEKAVQLQRTRKSFTVIHAHDWLVAYAAIALKHSYALPLVGTIHATEFGRHQGHLPGPMQKLIHQIEWWLTYESVRTICCSKYMREQLLHLFNLPKDKIDVIPNGIEQESFKNSKEVSKLKSRYVERNERMVFFVGRLVYEKGVQTVIDAMPLIMNQYGNVKFIVAGTGPHMRQLEDHASELGLADRISFLGFIPQDKLISFYNAADLTVVPSLYEPFGMVALESMCANTPCIVADTGGLSEIVIHEGTGLKFTPGDAQSLADAIIRVLRDDELRMKLTKDAANLLGEKYSWTNISRKTEEVYRRAAKEYEYRPRMLVPCPPIPDKNIVSVEK